MATTDTMTNTSLTIELRYFASLREALQCERESLQTRAATVGEVRQQLLARGGAYALALAPGKAVRAALNRVMCQDDTPITEGAELAFFPPVTGG